MRKLVCLVAIWISLAAFTLAGPSRAPKLQPAPEGARFTYHFRVLPVGDGTSIYWLEFLLADGKTVVWVPRYRIGTPRLQS